MRNFRDLPNLSIHRRLGTTLGAQTVSIFSLEFRGVRWAQSFENQMYSESPDSDFHPFGISELPSAKKQGFLKIDQPCQKAEYGRILHACMKQARHESR